MNKRLFWLLCLLGIGSILQADVKVTNVSVKPHYPWNGLMDITYSVQCGETDNGEPVDILVDFIGYDTILRKEFPMVSLTGIGASSPVKAGGPYKVTWNATKDYPTINSSAFQVEVHAITGIADFLVIDLPTWTKRYTNQPPNLDDDTCRTTKLWLRRIPVGTFMMGSPTGELGRNSDETQHQVTITQMFYIGVFQCTQRQWELVMGNNPSRCKGDCRPVDSVSYNMIRGTGAQAGAGWPTYGHKVDASSFLGRLQEKTGLTFDFPTEAQWEYACRAGTTTALNSGKDLTSTAKDANMDEVGRYQYNRNDEKGGYSEHTKVGSYLPNAWGLYDMHGNVWEWCLDWSGNYGSASVSDPPGPTSGSYRRMRGGGWFKDANLCRAAYRFGIGPSTANEDFGFRVACLSPFQ